MASIFPICMGKGNARNGLPNMGLTINVYMDQSWWQFPTPVVSDNTVKHF